MADRTRYMEHEVDEIGVHGDRIAIQLVWPCNCGLNIRPQRDSSGDLLVRWGIQLRVFLKETGINLVV